jgi:hypothetical protein
MVDPRKILIIIGSFFFEIRSGFITFKERRRCIHTLPPIEDNSIGNMWQQFFEFNSNAVPARRTGLQH